MSQHLNFTQTKPNYSFQHSFNLVYRKVETVLFCFLCVIFLILGKVSKEFTKGTSLAFISVSTPITKIVSLPVNGAINLVVNFSELLDAKRENKNLKQELESLKKHYITSLSIYRENIELKNIMNFASSKSAGYKVLKVIGRSHQIFNQKMFLNGGKDREIIEGSIVVADRSGIGRIIESYDNKSVVMLVTDSASHVPVIASKSRDRGILVGNGTNLMEITYLPKSHQITKGELIYTSGDGDTLPSGVLLGVVTSVSNDKVLVSMVEDLNKVDFVAVMGF